MIVTAGTVRRSVEAVLRRDLAAVLPALGEQEQVGLPPIVTWKRLADFLLITDLQSPAMVVTTPGLAGPADRRAREHHTDWLVRVFVVVRGRTYEETADRVAGYVAAARTVLLQEALLDDLAAGCDWVAETYSELDQDNARSLGAGSVTVRYRDVITALTPDPTAPGGAVPATDHDIVIDSRGSA